MKQIEKNIIASFNLAKRDIYRYHKDLGKLITNHRDVLKTLELLQRRDVVLNKKIQELEKKLAKKPKTIIKTITKKVIKKKKNEFWASKTGKSYHDPHCPFAHNINKKRKVVFKTKEAAKKKKYKACECVKRMKK